LSVKRFLLRRIPRDRSGDSSAPAAVWAGWTKVVAVRPGGL